MAELPLPQGADPGAARARGDAVHRKARLPGARRYGVAGEDGRDAARTRQDPGRAR